MSAAVHVLCIRVDQAALLLPYGAGRQCAERVLHGGCQRCSVQGKEAWERACACWHMPRSCRLHKRRVVGAGTRLHGVRERPQACHRVFCRVRAGHSKLLTGLTHRLGRGPLGEPQREGAVCTACGLGGLGYGQAPCTGSSPWRREAIHFQEASTAGFAALAAGAAA